MAKLNPDPINKREITEFLNSYSDFSFELKILKLLRDLGFNAEHSGVYEDSETGKTRQFDIRAQYSSSKKRIINLSVECKNIRENFPVVVSCTPRHENESYHQIAVAGTEIRRITSNISPGKIPYEYLTLPGIEESLKTVTLVKNDSIYKVDDSVGKETLQVGRNTQGKIISNDGELFDKWSQSLSSAVDLVSRFDWNSDKEELYFSTVIPIVVVPNNRLWLVDYNDKGDLIGQPRLEDRVSCFIDKIYETGSSALNKTWFSISHIELMTLDGINKFIKEFILSDPKMPELFPIEAIFNRLASDFSST